MRKIMINIDDTGYTKESSDMYVKTVMMFLRDRYDSDVWVDEWEKPKKMKQVMRWGDYPRNWSNWSISCPVDGRNDFEEEHELYTASYQIADNTELLVEWCDVCDYTKEETKGAEK